MKKFEIIMGGIVILSIIMKLLHFAGSGLLLTLSLLSLSIFYFLFSVALFNKIHLKKRPADEDKPKTFTKRVIGSIFLGFTLSIILNGILFKLQLWPGGELMMYIGIIFLVFILVVASIFYFRSRDRFYKRVFTRSIIIGLTGVLIFLLPMSTLIDIYFRDYPEYAELYKITLVDPQNMELQEQLRLMKLEMDGEEAQEIHEEK